MLTQLAFSQSDLTFFHAATHASEIMYLSRSLSRESCLQHYGADYNDLTPSDQHFFDYHFALGRNRAINSCVDALFSQMKGRQGLEAIKYYLANMALDKHWANSMLLNPVQQANEFKVTLTNDAASPADAVN